MAMIEGMSHITFVVSDLERTSRFLTTIFDARLVYDSGERGFSLSAERFFLIGDVWIAIMQGEALPAPTYNHVAFKIDERDLDEYAGRLRALGVAVREGRSRVDGEGSSLYFYDYDNHLFELHTGTLEQRLRRYAAG